VREIRRRTNAVGAFPDGNSALVLVAARLRYITDTKRSGKKNCTNYQKNLSMSFLIDICHANWLIIFIITGSIDYFSCH
jgi:hypothetical protein